MRHVFIHHLAFSLGETTMTVEASAAQGRTISSAAVLKEAGFAQHRICGSATSAYDLARRAVKTIENDLGTIDALVYATCIPLNASIGPVSTFDTTRDVKDLMDFPASHLQADFGLERAVVIGLNQQACTGMLGSLRLANMMLVAEPDWSRVLCVTADRFPEPALYEQSHNLISDGAAACMVSAEPEGFRLVASHAVTNGAMAQASDDETVGSFFNYSYRTMQEALRKARLDITAIDWIVPQNTHRKAWQILARLLPFDFGRVCFPTLAEVGHVISADNIINLKRMVDEDRIQSGERVLLFMAGYGLNWQCVILEKV